MSECKEKSFEEKLNHAGLLSFRLSEKINSGVDIPLDEEMDDIVWGYADGLKQKRIHDVMGGRCSIATSMAFDMAQEEKQIDKETVWLEELLCKVT